MPNSRQNDTGEFESLAFPYDRATGELTNTPRLTSGLNTYVSFGGKLSKRPGTIPLANSIKTSGTISRLVVYETIDPTPYVFLLASIKVGAVWTMFYMRRDDVTPTWTTMGTLRTLNSSTRPHEICIKRGLAYIKGYPSAASGEKLGTVLFDGTANTPYTTFWGILGPTAPATLTSPATPWPAATHPVTVLNGWKYTYCYVLKNGQVSNQAPLQTNPDLNPSVTGAFTNKIPQVTLTGTTDTTNVPYINVYRTTDGGGTFYFLKQVANPGATTVLFEDKYLGSGGGGTTYADPIPDANLDTTLVAPTLTSNSPPPSVSSPLVVGTDTIAKSTPVVEYAGRMWYAIGNILYFSALEEINDGVPEDSWPSGLFGNFFRFAHPVTNLGSTEDGLFVFTLQGTIRITGTNKETFNPKPYLGNVGAPAGHPRAVAPVGNSVAFLTHDFRIGLVERDQYQNPQFKVLSDPLFTDIVDAVNAGGEIQLVQWSELDKDYLVVCSHNNADTSLSRQWVYDLKRSKEAQGNFWFTPWTIAACCAASGRIQETVANRRLVFAIFNGTNSALARLDATARTATDATITLGTAGFSFYFNTHLMMIPTGNHYNALRRPAGTPVAQAVFMDRTRYGGDQDPMVFFYVDDFWTKPIQTIPETSGPWRRDDSKAYTSMVFNTVEMVGKRFAIRVQKLADTDLFELHTMALVWEPEGGA